MASSGMVLAAALVETGVVTWRAVTAKNSQNTIAGLPLPSIYLDVVVIYGALALLAGTSDGAKTVAGLIGWGYVAATFLTSGTGPINALTTAVGQSGGGTAPPSTSKAA